jgi:hypothetical protein
VQGTACVPRKIFPDSRSSFNSRAFSMAITVDGMERQADTAPASQPFWESLGFTYNAVEYGGHRGVTSLDLNRDSVPFSLRSSYDLVVNAGTTEHVVNQDNAFRVIHDLTKVGGVMMHEVPAGGMLTHGVVSYNPQFFWLLCRDNAYEVIDLTVAHAVDAPVSNDVLQSNARYARSPNAIQSRLSVPIFVITAILRKGSGAAFVTPLDVPLEALRRQEMALPPATRVDRVSGDRVPGQFTQNNR